MDTTTRIISQEKINTDSKTGLDRYSQVTSLNIDGDNNGLITVKGRIALLSATGVCMLVESLWEYTRSDKPATTEDVLVVDEPATYYTEGEILVPAVMDGETELTPAILAIGGELKTAEVSHYENKIVTPENNKYTALEQSQLGQGIKQMLAIDLQGAIINNIWTPINLKQL
jgi:hypothetical protein